MSSDASKDMPDFLKAMWGNFNMPIPGMVAPTFDTDELEKRITDMKAVEGWLKMNLNMLQMTIQGLEMQRATLAAMKAMSEAPGTDGGHTQNPFANPALWPWNFMNPVETAVGAATGTGSNVKKSDE